jgi:hypothetical protein
VTESHSIVARVCDNHLAPGAILHINSVIDLPPSASFSTLVRGLSLYGIIVCVARHGDLSEKLQGYPSGGLTEPLFRAVMTRLSAVRLLLIDADSAIRDFGAGPTSTAEESDLLRSDPARSMNSTRPSIRGRWVSESRLGGA